MLLWQQVLLFLRQLNKENRERDKMDYRQYNDYELIDYVRESSEEANDILFAKYRPLIMSFAKKMYPYCRYNGIEIADLVQEGLLGLNLAIVHFKDNKDNSFYTFARKCIERKMLSLVIASRRQKHKILNESLSLEFSDEEGEMGILESVLSDFTFNPESKLLSFEREKELLDKVKGVLTESESKVFELKVAGFHYKEIAAILDKTPKSIDNALQRMKHKCRQVLKKEE